MDRNHSFKASNISHQHQHKAQTDGKNQKAGLVSNMYGCAAQIPSDDAMSQMNGCIQLHENAPCGATISQYKVGKSWQCRNYCI